jgi:hypothetical protein
MKYLANVDVPHLKVFAGSIDLTKVGPLEPYNPIPTTSMAQNPLIVVALKRQQFKVLEDGIPPLLENIISLLPPSVPKSEDNAAVTAIQKVFGVISEEEFQKMLTPSHAHGLTVTIVVMSCMEARMM